MVSLCGLRDLCGEKIGRDSLGDLRGEKSGMGERKDIMPSTYDEIPYESQSFSQTHPDRLATIATLFGMTPPPVRRCRVLELGCAMGANLIPMASMTVRP